MEDPQDLDQHIGRSEDGVPCCLICPNFKHSSKYHVRNHVESKHFPDTFIYTCHICQKQCNNRKALENHIQKHKKEMRQ